MGKTNRHEKKSKKKHKHKDKEHKEKKKKSAKKSKKVEKPKNTANVVVPPVQVPEVDNFEIPVDLMNCKSHAPETAEEFQKRQQYIRRVTDPVTGRTRLIKGDGEVLEEIVTRERHVDINKAATAGDGNYYQENTLGRHKRK